jgi:hypothetical protein
MLTSLNMLEMAMFSSSCVDNVGGDFVDDSGDCDDDGFVVFVVSVVVVSAACVSFLVMVVS